MPNNDFFNNSFLKNDPTDLFRDLGKQVFNQFSSQAFPVNLYNENDHYLIEAELSGVKKEDISLTFEQHTLTIKANKYIESHNGQTQLNERSSGELVRRFEFEDIDKSLIKATFENGILNVRLPKQQQEAEDATTISIS
ncbi:Hsp20/alpha crystallin family protein [Staphylococcus pasteuri]|uniref:Hsp20/alpha crystallin family protein n=1 Tax=Staphylococcus pasteuri TaxID=45972 RepID=UPI000E396DB8|nr:Hsp20/alpha crystallin family protein [Staphylococcus pasteuri]RFD74084.1 heat-shock protein Hsp20 [Staphylococcus pasteuri]